MAAIRTLFVDDGDVMNDNGLRAPQWRRLLGEYLPPRLGGTPTAWAEANRIELDRLIVRYAERVTPETDFLAYWVQDRKEWLRGMCDLVGVAAPKNDDDCFQLARETVSYVIPRVRAAYPGVVETLQSLHAEGYELHTASGEHSEELDGYLTGMGVRHLFDRLYGADLVNTAKVSPLYYERIFSDAGVPPAQALVIDNSPAALGWAREVGAQTVLVSSDGGGVEKHVAVVGSLAELQAALSSTQDQG